MSPSSSTSHLAIVLAIAAVAIQCTSAGTDSEGESASSPLVHPAPTEPCAPCVLGAVVERACGACGTQKAVCVAGDDGAPRLGAFSACVNELTHGCIPGTVEGTPCGQGGTQSRVCDSRCTWLISGCAQGAQPSF